MHRLLRYTIKLGTVLVVFIAVQTSAADWPQFGGRNRDSATDRDGIMRSWPKGGPEKLWRVKLGRGFGAPVVADGEAYLLDRKVGTSQTLRCFSLSSGKEKWSYTWASKGGVPVSGSRAQPLVNEQYVFAVGARGRAYCFNRSTHKPVWKVNLLKKYGADLPRWGIAQSPLAHKNRVILAPNGKEAGVVALDQDTGEEVWTSKPIGKRKRGSYTSPMLATIGGVQQILYTAPDVTVGIRASDGQVLWKYRDWYCKIPIVSPVHVSDGRVLITGGYGAGTQMFRVQKSAGGFNTTTLWKTDARNCQIHQPLVYKNHIYIIGNSNKRSDGMMCFDMQGNLQWKTGRDPNFGRGGMIRVGDRIFAVDDTTGDVVLIKPSPRGYQEVGRRTYLSGPKKWAPLALADGKLLIRDQKKMVCVDVRDK